MTKKLVFGIGLNDVDYHVYSKVNGKTVICHYYATWKHMLERCYCKKYLSKKPTYEGCEVCDEWLRLSIFKKWMETQDWEGKQLDKDLLLKGNKVYSPETCIFVEKSLNSFLTENNAKRGGSLIGVSRAGYINKFRAQCGDYFGGGKSYLGVFDSEIEAHAAWKKRKHEIACQLADLQTDERVAKALRERYL